MLKFANKIMALFVLCIVLIGVHILPLPAYAEEDYELARLKEQLQIGEAAELGLAARRDAELKKIFHEGLSQKQIEIKAEAVLETYRVESSKLVAKYRQPLMEHLQKKYPGLKDSVGTPLYAKDAKGNVVLDAQGRKVVHSDFRGWSGDHDMQGSATDVAKAKKYLNDNGFATTGFGSKELKDLTPGDLSNKSLELTINLNPTNQSIKDLLKTEALSPEVHSQLEADLARSQLSDSMLKAGDTAHQTVASVAARGKETYVSVSMQNGQPGLKAVLVNDHLKKAVEGLGMGGEDLLDMNNRDAFQGMIKGTDKAVRDGQLDAAVIEATLKKHQLDMSAADYQGLMTKLKVKPYPQIYGLDAAKMENLKNVNQELLDQSVTKTLKDAAVEVESHRKKVADLTAQINQATDPAEKQNLTAQREMLGRQIVDTRVKLQEVLAANDERRQKYKLPPRPPVAEADSLKLTPETAPSSNHASLKAKSDLKKTARQGLAAAGQGMELYGYYSTAMQHAEEVVAESSPSDSDVMLIIEATKRGTMEAIGLNDAIEIQKENLPLMRDAMENIHKGNYFTGLYQWKAAMTLGMWELSKRQFNDMILTPLQDTGIAVYEGGRVVYDLLKDDVNITNNEAEQAQQQTAIAQKKEMLAATEPVIEVPVVKETEPSSVVPNIVAATPVLIEPESKPSLEKTASSLTQGTGNITAIDEDGHPMRSNYYLDSAFVGYLLPPSGLQPPLQWSAESMPGELARVTIKNQDFVGNNLNTAERGWRAYLTMEPLKSGSGAVRVRITDSAGKTVGANLPLAIDESSEALARRIGMASKNGDWHAVRRAMDDYPDIMQLCLAGGIAHNPSSQHCVSGGVRLASIALVNASVRDDAVLVRDLIAAGADPNAKANDGTAVLMLALGANHASVIDTLVKAGSDVNMVWRDGLTPLHIAAMRGNVALAEKLLAAGARPVADAKGHAPGYYLYWGGNQDAALASRLGYNDGFDYDARAQAQAQSSEDWNLFAQAMLEGLAGAAQEYQSYQTSQLPSSGMATLEQLSEKQPEDWDDFVPMPGNAYVSPPAQAAHAAEIPATSQKNEELKKCVLYTFSYTRGSTFVSTLNETSRCISLLTLKPEDIPDPIKICGKIFYVGGSHALNNKQKIYEMALRDQENYKIRKNNVVFAECAPHPL